MQYEVTIERIPDGKRFKRTILACDEQQACGLAYLYLLAEPQDYYVVSAELAATEEQGQ